MTLKVDDGAKVVPKRQQRMEKKTKEIIDNRDLGILASKTLQKHIQLTASSASMEARMNLIILKILTLGETGTTIILRPATALLITEMLTSARSE